MPTSLARLSMINDHKKIEEVYNKSEEYLENHKELRDEAITYIWAYYEIEDLVPQTVVNIMSGHFFPFSESYYELENSYELCKQGYYRYSLFALRCVLELGVIGLYYDKDDQSHIDIQDWFHSKEPTPYFRKSMQRLFKFEYFRQFDDKFSLMQEVINIYSSLNDYVHVRGFRYSTRGQTRANFNQFNEVALLRYVNFMKRVVKSITTMMLLKYPIGMQNLPLWDKFGFNLPLGGLLDESSQSAILTILNEDTKRFLQDISDNDPRVKEIIRDILAMPDLTEEEFKKQEYELDKFIKEHEYKETKKDEEEEETKKDEDDI